MKKILLAALPLLILIGCKERKKNVTLTQPINLNGAVSTNQPLSQPTTQQTTAQVPSGYTGKTNPAHGQPGHRCDLEVGAPLNSEPISASIPAQANQTQLPPISSVIPNTAAQQVTTTTAPAKGSGKLNPAHGQPGHRCDLEVGAPLDGAPAPKNTPTVTPVQAAPNTTITPVVTPTLPGMNPQHGQPGHRCDIAVGAPLNSPKTDTEKKDSSKS